MTVSYIIIIVIIWKKSSVKIKDQTSNDRNEKSKIRRLISAKRTTLIGTYPVIFSLSSSSSFSYEIDDHQMESSIRNARSLGVIPRAKIKTVKMTLVIVIGKTLSAHFFT